MCVCVFRLCVSVCVFVCVCVTATPSFTCECNYPLNWEDVYRLMHERGVHNSWVCILIMPSHTHTHTNTHIQRHTHTYTHILSHNGSFQWVLAIAAWPLPLRFQCELNVSISPPSIMNPHTYINTSTGSGKRMILDPSSLHSTCVATLRWHVLSAPPY